MRTAAWVVGVSGVLAMGATARPAASEGVEEVVAARQAAEGRSAPARFSWTRPGRAEAMNVRADRKRDEAIEKLRRLLSRGLEDLQQAELLFRLAELYWGKSRYLHLAAMKQWDAALQRWHEAGRHGAEPTLEGIAETREAEQYMGQALELYEQVLRDHSDYDRKDEVLFNLASSLYEAGEHRKAVRRYEQLLAESPQSVFAADAHLELGDHFFSINALPKAVASYDQAAAGKKPRIYAYALYKLAWCDVNLQAYEGALERLREVVAYARSQQEASPEPGAMGEKDRIQLMHEALADMVLVFSHLDAVESALDFYEEEMGPEEAYRYIRKLAQLYRKQGRHSLEIRTYQRLNARFPYAAKAPMNQAAIVSSFAELGRGKQAREEARRLVDLYAPGGAWAQDNAANQRALGAAFQAVEAELARLATRQHQAAQQTQLTEKYKLARDLYEEYLASFAEGINAYRFRFLYAEILFDLKEYRAAAKQYDQVVKQDPAGEFARPAAYAAVLAWEKVVARVREPVGRRLTSRKRGKGRGSLGKLERLERLERGKRYQRQQLDASESRLAEAYDTFVRVAPEDEEGLKVLFKSAQLYHTHNQFDAARKRFGDLIAREPSNPLAPLAADCILRALTVRGSWAELKSWARRFLASKHLVSSQSFRRDTEDLLEGAAFNEIHLLIEKKASPRATAEHYSAFVQEFPNGKYALIGLHNAMIHYSKASMLEQAMAAAEEVLNSGARSKHRKQSPKPSGQPGDTLPGPAEIRAKTAFMLAHLCERAGELERAARLYERYGREFPQGPKRADALYSAGVLHQGLGNVEGAMSAYALYVRSYSDKGDVAEVDWRMALLQEQSGDYQGAARRFAGLALRWAESNPARAMCAQHHALEARAVDGGTGPDRREQEKLLERYNNLPRAARDDSCALEAAAATSFSLVESTLARYRALRLQGSERQMRERLVSKSEMVAVLTDRYARVLGLGHGGYGIAALYRIGEIYEHLAQTLSASACPRRLTEDQCAIYQAALQERAFPLEEKAIEAYRKAVEKAYELGLYTDWLGRAQEALKRYEPGRFPPKRELELLGSDDALGVAVWAEGPQ